MWRDIGKAGRVRARETMREFNYSEIESPSTENS